MTNRFFSRYPVSPPAIAENEVNILRFGAVGDGKHLNTAALQRAIDSCSRQGGGKVVVPEGAFLTGTFYLKTGVHLYLEKGGVILGSPFLKDYPTKTTGGTQALVRADRQSRIMISGEGVINGNARLDSTGDFRDTGNNDMRPTLLWFENCTDVTVKKVTFRQSLMWTAIFAQCRHLWISEVRITENYFYNTDGIDVTDCEDALVENCDINTDDDGICLKSYSGGCRRVVVRNNKVRSLCNAIKFGTGSTGGFRNILVENNEIWQTVISGIALQIVDGGIMDDIVVRNITMNGVGTALTIRLGSRNKRGGATVVQTGILRNVRISGITATVGKAQRFNEAETQHHDYAPYTSSICGIPGHYIENVIIEDVKITLADSFPAGVAADTLREIPENAGKYPENRMFGKLPSYGLYIRHVRGLQLRRIHISAAQPEERPAFLLDDVHDTQTEQLTADTPKPAPLLVAAPGCSRIFLG